MLKSILMNFVCPACGFMALENVPWYQKTLVSGQMVWRTSHEICVCCGIEFGCDDWAGGNLEERAKVHKIWRLRWVKSGMRFVDMARKPADWSAEQNGLWQTKP